MRARRQRQCSEHRRQAGRHETEKQRDRQIENTGTIPSSCWAKASVLVQSSNAVTMSVTFKSGPKPKTVCCCCCCLSNAVLFGNVPYRVLSCHPGGKSPNLPRRTRGLRTREVRQTQQGPLSPLAVLYPQRGLVVVVVVALASTLWCRQRQTKAATNPPSLAADGALAGEAATTGTSEDGASA